MFAYRVILDIKDIEVYEPGMPIYNKIKERYNEAELLMEDVRLKLDKNILPRLGAIYVCKSIEHAHKWYSKIDVKQGFNYYVYKLNLIGDIQWHNPFFYEKVFSLVYHDNKTTNDFELNEIAKSYWLSDDSKDGLLSEGLFWGKAIVLDRKYFVNANNLCSTSAC